MSEFFLHIVLKSHGINAMIMEQSAKNNLVHSKCQILFEDLGKYQREFDLKNSDNSNIKDKNFDDKEIVLQRSEIEYYFDESIDFIADKLDLSLCSSAIIFISCSQFHFRNIFFPFSSKKKNTTNSSF